uniref:FKBP-type peptidyl-prolyl cis-trans isomerase n=1 Tax=uncultured Sphingomonas sp. TaxID=158754 RepID=UPI0035CC9ECD
MRGFAFAAALSAALLPAVAAHAVPKKVVRHAAKAPVAPLSPAAAFLAANARQRGVVQTASGLQYRVLSPGSGTARPGDDDVTLVNYVGTLTTGKVFDQSAHPTPMPVSGVVPGFSESLKLMPKGAKYRVWIKPSLGYGDRASGPIPAGSVLVFDIELLDFVSAAQFQQMQQQAPQPGAPN